MGPLGLSTQGSFSFRCFVLTAVSGGHCTRHDILSAAGSSKRSGTNAQAVACSFQVKSIDIFSLFLDLIGWVELLLLIEFKVLFAFKYFWFDHGAEA